MATIQSKPIIVGEEKLKVYYKTKRWFLFSWDVVVKTETMGRKIYIVCEDEVDVYLNDELIH